MPTSSPTRFATMQQIAKYLSWDHEEEPWDEYLRSIREGTRCRYCSHPKSEHKAGKRAPKELGLICMGSVNGKWCPCPEFEEATTREIDRANVAFRDALRSLYAGKSTTDLSSGQLEFYCGDGFDLTLPEIAPSDPHSEVLKVYGDFGVICHIDHVDRRTSTAQTIELIDNEVDEERAEFSFDSMLWRLALDATGLNTFRHTYISAWASDMQPWEWMLVSSEDVVQHRYDGISQDCAEAVDKYARAAQKWPEMARHDVQPPVR